jgi:hypothetical protein
VVVVRSRHLRLHWSRVALSPPAPLLLSPSCGVVRPGLAGALWVRGNAGWD